MKIKIRLGTDGRSTMEVECIIKQLKLESGEVINVGLDKRYKGLYFATHIESGLMTIPACYYDEFRSMTAGTLALKPDSIKNALRIVKHTFDQIYKTQGLTFEQKLKNREKELEGVNKK